MSKESRIYTEERTVSLINGAQKIRWLHGERMKLEHSLIACKNKLKNGLNTICNIGNQRTLRRKYRQNTL